MVLYEYIFNDNMHLAVESNTNPEDGKMYIVEEDGYLTSINKDDRVPDELTDFIAEMRCGEEVQTIHGPIKLVLVDEDDYLVDLMTFAAMQIANHYTEFLENTYPADLNLDSDIFGSNFENNMEMVYDLYDGIELFLPTDPELEYDFKQVGDFIMAFESADLEYIYGNISLLRDIVINIGGEPAESLIKEAEFEMACELLDILVDNDISPEARRLIFDSFPKDKEECACSGDCSCNFEIDM